MKYSILIWVAILTTSITCSAKQYYKTSDIPDSLLTSANAVIRLFNTQYVREDAEIYVKQVTIVTTVLNKRGQSEAWLVIPYDRNSKVTLQKALIYNKNGDIIKKYKKNDLLDSPNNQSFTLFSDNRIKHLHPVSTTYPYTVEYQYSIENNGTVGFPSWLPQSGFDVSTESALLSVTSPQELALKSKALNHEFSFGKTVADGVVTHTWKVANLKAIKYEANSLPYSELIPMVLLTPVDIAFEGTTGDFTSWNSYGKWVNQLITDRNHLTPATVTAIRALTDTIADDYNKVKAVYKYMQNRTRYVNIALGIGGFQPLDAIDVDEKGYGDCKALSNYTKTLLGIIGIESFYTEIGATKNQEIKYPDFPSAYHTNHIILCVPLSEDTVWLECTSQNLPCGFLSTVCSNRYALCITDDGGKLVKTPTYKTEDNIRSSVCHTKLYTNGSAAIDLDVNYQDGLYSEIYSLIYSSAKEQREMLLKNLTSDGIHINKFAITDRSDRHAKGNLTMQANVDNYAIFTGNRLIITPNLLLKQDDLYSVHSSRKHPLYRPIGVTYLDTIIIEIPENYEVEFMPSSLCAPCKCGTFKIKYEQIEATRIGIYRQLIIQNNTFDNETFVDINKFVSKVVGHTNNKIALIQIDKNKKQ